MLAFLVALVIATLLGFLAGMGVGGGSLLLLWLSQVVMMPQEQARILNLLFYLPAALVATLFRGKQQLRRDMILPALVSGCAAALCFTILGQYWDVNILKKGLGFLLILIGLREVFYRPRNAK